jgi:hypothetical protein
VQGETGVAVQALRNGEIPAAFVGGVNLILTLEYHFAIGQIGALSPTTDRITVPNCIRHTFQVQNVDSFSAGIAICGCIKILPIIALWAYAETQMHTATAKITESLSPVLLLKSE